MAHRMVITDEIIQSGLVILQKLIDNPPPPGSKHYSRKEAFIILREKAREALAVGHPLETVLGDLKGIGLGMTLSSARQYLKPGTKPKKQRKALNTTKHSDTSTTQNAAVAIKEPFTGKARFTKTEDDEEI